MRPTTQLFMLQSLDGKISTGPSDEFDVDRDFPQLPATKAGLHRYYELEKETDLWSLNSGRTMAKCGVNTRQLAEKPFVNFVVIDNHNLEAHGVEWFCSASPTFVLITTNHKHIAFSMPHYNMRIIFQPKLNLTAAMKELYALGCRELTCQVGSTLNGILFREHLIDRINVVVAPIIIGGVDTPSIVGGPSLTSHSMIKSLSGLKLVRIDNLGDSYVRMMYDVIH